MRRLIIAALVTMTLMVPATAATATTRTSTLSFQLAPPNTAVAPKGGMMGAPGDSIKITGGGTVTAGRAVHAKGGFVHYNKDGTVHCKGWWEATAVTGWRDFGGQPAGRHGGVLSLVVTHHCTTMGEVHTGIPMTVTSTLNAPPGSAYTEGTTVSDFTIPTGGRVSIWAHGQAKPRPRAHPTDQVAERPDPGAHIGHHATGGGRH